MDDSTIDHPTYVVVMWEKYEGWWGWLFKWHVCVYIESQYIKVFLESVDKGVVAIAMSRISGIGVDADVVMKAPYVQGMVNYSIFEPFTCVNLVKRLIGINSIFIQTPRALMRRMEKEGWAKT